MIKNEDEENGIVADGFIIITKDPLINEIISAIPIQYGANNEAVIDLMKWLCTYSWMLGVRDCSKKNIPSLLTNSTPLPILN